MDHNFVEPAPEDMLILREDVGESALEDLTERVSQKVESHQGADFNPKKHRDETRSWIAKAFVIGFGSIILLTYAYVFIHNWYFDTYLDLKDSLIGVSTLVSSPFGFVIGYYFKGSEE